ncbi:TIR-NBS-LRR-like protein, partial [Parasponia andersonii]
NESNVIKEIVEEVSRVLDLTFPPSGDKDLVGVGSRARKLTESYLDKDGGVHTVGIWGPGGIGKTTTAKEVFKNIRGNFEACGFVNVRELSEKQGLDYVRRQLYEMLLDQKIKKQDVDDNKLRRRLVSKKVLIVLDDVDHIKQIENLVGKADQQPSWFGQGSRIIVTTRDKHLLKSYGEDNIYEIEKLTDDEALRLLCRRAFMKYDPEDEYSELSKSVVKYAQGLPLALELLGCLLNGRSMDEWVDAVNRLEQNPTNEMCKTLQLSYEGLEKPEKQIFLDIACFFKGEDKHRVKRLLEGCGFHPIIGLSILVEKSLITIEEGKIWMHDMGTRDVQGLFLSWSGEEKVVLLNADPFSEMKNIRLLKICNVYFSGCAQYDLSKKLRLLEWHGYPLEMLPSSFRPDKLVELTMPNSRIEKLWKETEVPNLESLILEGCERLTEIHPSIGVLHHLVTLNLKYCRRLEKLPKSINLKALKTFTLAGCINLSEFPEIVGEMKNLSELDLNGTAIRDLPRNGICNLTFLKYLIISDSSNIDTVPENLGNYLEHLEQFFADGTSIRKVPSSVLLMKKLKILCFRGCRGLQLPNSLTGLCSLIKLDLSFCDLAEGAIPDDIGSLSLLEHLNLSGNYFTSIPETISQLSQLRELLLFGCCMLQSLPNNLPPSLEDIDVSDCYALRISDDMTTRISENGFPLISSNNKFGFIGDSKNSFGPVDKDSTIGTPLTMPEEFWPRFFEEKINDKKQFEFRFPFTNKVLECCENWNPGSSIMIKPSPDQDHRYNIRKGIAVFIVFEIKERRIFSGEDLKSEKIHCHIHTQEGRVENFLSFHDFKDFRVGSFGACSYTPQDQFPRKLNQESQVIGVSFSVNTPNLELRKCGMHFIDELNTKEFSYELAMCNPSAKQLEGEVSFGQHCLQLLDEAITVTTRTIYQGDIQPHHEAEDDYNAEDISDPTSQMKRDVESLLLRLYQGRIARTCTFFFLMPPILLSPWFFHHSLGDTTFCCYLPPNLHDDKSWLGLELYVVFDRRKYSENPTLLLGVELYVHAGSNTLPVLRYDIIIDGSVLGPRLVLYHIPRGRLPEQLNQSTGISVLFTSTTQDVEVEFCGTGLLYEKESKRLVKHISNMTLGRPEILFSLHQQAQSLIVQMEEFCGNTDIGEHNGGERSPEPDFSYFSTFQSKKELIESLNKLLTHMESMTKDVSNSTLQNYRYVRNEHGYNEEYYSISEVLLHNVLINQQPDHQQSGALMCPNLYHSHVMVENLIHGNDFEKWKRNLEIILERSFNTCGLVTLSLKGHILSVLRYFDHRSAFNFNFPIKEIPEWFDHQSGSSASKIQLPQNLQEDKNWMGLVICAAFSIHEQPSSFSESTFKILCHLTTSRSCVNVAPLHSITKDKFSWLHVRGFIWLTYVPHHQLLTELTQASHISARIYNPTPGLVVNKCGIRLLCKQDLTEFKKAIIQCWTSFFDDLDPIFGFVADENGKLLHDDNKPAVKITRGMSDTVPRSINPPKTNYQDFDGESIYNACFPPTESLKWFVDLRNEHSATIKLPPDHSDANWIGLALCAYFSYPDDQQSVATTSLENLDPELFSHYLFCHFETETVNSEFIHRYQYRQSDGNPNRLDKKEFIWVSFLPRRRLLETIQQSSQLDECIILEASFGCDVLGMVVNKCGLRLLYQHDQEEFKQVLNKIMDCQQPYQEPKAEDENDQVPFITPNTNSPVFVQKKYQEAKQSPLVYDPIQEFDYEIGLSSARPTNPQVATLEDTMNDPSIAEFDAILNDIQNCLNGKGNTKPEIRENDLLPTSSEAINRAKKILQQFMGMEMSNLIHPGRKSELKDSLSILLSTKKVFPNDMVDEMTKFSEMFNQHCHRYEAAQKDLEEAKGKEISVVELQNKLKQFTCELKPVKMKLETIDGEIVDLDKKLTEKKASRERLRSSFEDLKGQAMSTKQALLEAKKDAEVVGRKKKEAEDCVKEFEDGWQTLVDCCSQHIFD